MKKIMSFLLIFSLMIPFNCIAAETDDTTVFFEDFEGMEIGQFPSEIGGKSVSYYQSAANEPQNVIDVQKDAFGSKAMRFVINTKTSNSSTTFRIPFGKNLREGVYEFSFDVRAENDSRYFSRFFQLWNEKDQSEIWGETASGYLYPLGRSEQPGANFNIGSFDKESYFKVKFVFNMDTRKYISYVNDVQIGAETALPRAVDSAECGLSQMVIYANNGNYNGKDNDGTDVNPGVYWIDNIKIKKNLADITERYPENNSENISADNPVRIVLDHDFNKSTVNKDNVELYEDGIKLNGEDYDVNCDKNIVTVEKSCGGFDYNKKYSVKFSDKIAVSDGMAQIDTQSMQTEFKTESIIDIAKDVLSDGKRYNDGYKIVMPDVADIKYTLYILNDEEEKEYSGEALVVGNYEFKVKAENAKNGKTEEQTINIEVVGKCAPVAQNVKIDGVPETGGVLRASYDYSDVNGDAEGKSLYAWLKSENPETGFEAIEGADGLSYCLTEEDENCYIKFAVIPVSQDEPFFGEQSFSDVFKGSFSPIARNIKITGDALIGATLEGSYEYFDENDEPENGTEFVWVKDSKKDGKFDEMLKTQNGNTCVIGEEDIDCFIKLCVIPKNDGKSKQDNKFYSELVLAPFSPTAENVKIIGTARVGQTIGASYSFYDENGDEEGESIIEWYADGEKVADGKNLMLQDSFEGASVYFTVTPVSKISPKTGKTVSSEQLSVAAKKRVSYGGGGGGGASIVIPVKPSENEPQDETKEEEENITFNDISGHWAEKNILSLAKRKIIAGMGDGRFNPDGKITRAQFATIMSKIAKKEEKEYRCKFSDVPEEAWYYDTAAVVSALGVMNGDGNRFRPNDYIKREEMAVAICNILKNNGITTEKKNLELTDITEISDWALESVAVCVDKGIITGYSDGSFGGGKYATRAEVTVMTERLLKIMEGDASEE